MEYKKQRGVPQQKYTEIHWQQESEHFPELYGIEEPEKCWESARNKLAFVGNVFDIPRETGSVGIEDVCPRKLETAFWAGALCWTLGRPGGDGA
tara:strand:- start:662 stop:943 length:282 start_codon:yes stop_codon:yes gene_type:complete